MRIKDAIPARSVLLEIHFVDQYGKTVTETDPEGNEVLKIRRVKSKEAGELLNLLYEVVIPLGRKYIFYVKEDAKNEKRLQRKAGSRSHNGR